MNFGLHMVVLFVLCYYGSTVFAVKSSPKIIHHSVYFIIGIKLAWNPPEETGNSSVVEYLVRWKNSTDEQYQFDKKIDITEMFDLSRPPRYVIFLNSENNIRPCSSFDIEVSAIFSDLSVTSANVTVATETPTGSRLHQIMCRVNASTAMEVQFDPHPNYYSACNFQLQYTVRAEGYSQWNKDKEEIPKFETSQPFVLSGLSPNTKYIVYVKEESSEKLEQCSDVTLREGPGPVTVGKVYSSSPTSIFASWSPPMKAYGEIIKYWIETIKIVDKSKNILEVQSKFTRIILQNLTPECEYQLVVWAENAAGIGERSEVVEVSTGVVPLFKDGLSSLPPVGSGLQ